MYITMDDSVVAGHPTIQGNDKLKPEYALGFNLGLEYSKPGLFSARVNGYYSELWNEIINDYQGTIGGKETYRNENVARSLRTGFDSEARLTLFTSAFVSAAYSWIYAYDRTEEEELHVQPARGARAKIGLDHKQSGLYAYLQGRYYSPIDPDDPDYDSRFIFDFYAALSFAKHFKVHISVDNLTGLIDPQGPDVGRIFTIGFNYVL
jgi:outer membrane receptor for ferrienterochelin and colicins